MQKKLKLENVDGSLTFSTAAAFSKMQNNNNICPQVSEKSSSNIINPNEHGVPKNKENTKLEEGTRVVTSISNKNKKRETCKMYSMLILNRDSTEEIFISAVIENIKFSCLVDTGATICVIGRKADNLWEKVCDKPIFKNTTLRTGGNEIHQGVIKKLSISYDNCENIVQFVYSPTIAGGIVLGMNFINLWHMDRAKKEFFVSDAECLLINS